MNQKEQTTDELEHITSNLCRGDAEIEAVTNALKEALAIYQWEYQKVTDRAKVNIEKQLNDALEVVKEHLEFLGQYTLIGDLEEVFDQPDVGLAKTNILTLIKRHMKAYCVNNGIPSKRYNNEFAKNMTTAFIEWCEVYPLDEAPEHLDLGFEPTL